MKKVLYVILGLGILYLILCFVGPSQIRVERSIEIDSPADVIKMKLADYKFFHEAWSPWTEKDPGMKKTYSGDAGTIGHKLSWESDSAEVGKGSMTYNYTSGDTVMHTLYFDGQGDAKIYHLVSPGANGSKVTWVMDNKIPLMARAMMLFMNMDKMLGPDFEKGLGKLKTAIESMPAAQPTANYQVKEMNWEAKTFYGIRGKMEFMKMAAFFGESYGKIGQAIGKAKATPIGAPKAIYFSFDEKTMVGDLAAVMEFANGTKLAGLEKWETPAGKVLLIEYYGSYDKSGNAHYAMDAYMKEKGYTQGTVLEEYVTDPMSEKDTAKWLTNIFYMVK